MGRVQGDSEPARYRGQRPEPRVTPALGEEGQWQSARASYAYLATQQPDAPLGGRSQVRPGVGLATWAGCAEALIPLSRITS